MAPEKGGGIKEETNVSVKENVRCFGLEGFSFLLLIKVVIFNCLTKFNQTSHVTAVSLRLPAQILLNQAIWVIQTNKKIDATFGSLPRSLL